MIHCFSQISANITSPSQMWPTFLNLLYSCHDVVPGVLLVPLPFKSLRGDVASDSLHLFVVVPRRLLEVLGLLLKSRLIVRLLGDGLAWYEGRQRDLLVAGAARGHLAPLPLAGPGADLPPLLVSPEQVVGAREEARQWPHGEGRGGVCPGGSQERSEVGRDGAVWGMWNSSRGWSFGWWWYWQSTRTGHYGVPIGRNDGVWWSWTGWGGSYQDIFSVSILMVLDHPLHLEHLRHPEQGWELVLCHGDLAPVHVVQDGADLVSLHVLPGTVRVCELWAVGDLPSGTQWDAHWRCPWTASESSLRRRPGRSCDTWCFPRHRQGWRQWRPHWPAASRRPSTCWTGGGSIAGWTPGTVGPSEILTTEAANWKQNIFISQKRFLWSFVFLLIACTISNIWPPLV